MRTAERDRQFEEFVSASWPRLLRAAYLLTHDHGDAEELLQQVLMKAYVSWPRIRKAEAHAYVRRSLVNAYIDSRRKHLVQLVFGDYPERPNLDAHGVEDRSEIIQLLRPLSPRERSMIVCRYYFDLHEDDVARLFGVTGGTVKSTISRALGRVRTAIDEAAITRGGRA